MLSITTDLLSSFTLNIDINQKHDFVPKSESIKKYIDSEVERVLDESIFEDKDEEIISFKPKSDFTLRPYFKNNPSYIDAGFTNYYLTASTLFKEESFYLFDIYDSYIDNNQKLISRNYLKMTKFESAEKTTDITFIPKKISKEYINIYIPSYFINTTADTFYLKVSFFNATNGTLRIFRCSEILNQDNSKNYFKVKLDKTNKTYDFIGVTILSINPNVYKISEIIEPIKEQTLANANSIARIKPILKTKKTITTKGKFI